MSAEEMKNAFKRIIEHELQEFVAASEAFGIQEMTVLAALVRKAFNAELEFIREGVHQQRPADENDLRRLAEPICSVVAQITELRENSRHLKEYGNHLATVADSVTALSWIILPRTPVQFIRDMREAGDYFGNRVLVANKGNDLHVTWINKWITLMAALEEYVRRHHLTGFAWNTLPRREFLNRGEGEIVTAFAQSLLMPPPPPPPPSKEAQQAAENEAKLQAEREADRQQLLIQLSQGEQIQKMLKPVDRKATERAPVVQRTTGTRQQAVRGPAGQPVFVLEGRRWRVEFQNDKPDLRLQPTDKSESLALYNCERSSLRTSAKMNAVTIDNCKRCKIVLQDIIASVELIHCKNVELHCCGNCPTVTLDNCDSVQVFLRDNSSQCEIITSSSTSTNICRLDDDGQYVEFPVPEQIRSILRNGNLHSSVVEHHS